MSADPKISDVLADRRMPPDVRRAAILKRLQQTGSATIGQLSHDLGVSAVTIHRDLDQLEHDGSIARLRGGASLTPVRALAPYFDTHWSSRLRSESTAKAAIAVLARDLIEPDSTIFLDGSTSALALAAAIEVKPRPLTIVTDSPAIGASLASPHVRVIMTPGWIDNDLRMVAGRWTVDFLKQFNYNASFVSCAAVDLKTGATTTRTEISDAVHAVNERSEHRYLLADASKFGKSALLSLGALNELDAIVTNGAIGLDTVSAYSKSGVHLIVAAANAGDAAIREVSASQVWMSTFGRLGAS